MRVFVTGATGTIGFAVSSAFARGGHEVYGLVRSPEKAKRLAGAEALAVIGDMAQPRSYKETLRHAQVLVHCAADYSERSVELDRTTVHTLLEAASQPNLPRKVLYTSGCWQIGDTGDGFADEATAPNPLPFLIPRVETEQVVLAANRGQVRTIVIRPGCVYGGNGSLTSTWFETAKRDGSARYIGDGSARWAMVHLSDLADAYVRAAESAWGGEIFNVTDHSRFTVLECASAASKAAGANGKVHSVTVEEAAKTLGPIAQCLVMTQHLDSSKATRLLGWQPRHSGFVDGVRQYFAAWQALAG
jgi:nucleoside-diphosphate-sugar epimerase